MGFKWSLNPYMGCVHRCTFCYVRHFEHRSDRPSDDGYGTSIRVKTNVAEVLRKELARASWQHEHVAIGAATDPYQPAEGKYKLTRACLETLRNAANPFSIITRGPMIVRDLDVLVEAAQRASVSVSFSIPTVDEEVWTGIWANLLFLRPGTREHFLAHLAEDWPEQLPLYEELYAGKAYLGAELMKPVRNEVWRLAREHGIGDRRKVRLAPPPEPEQLSLSL